MRSQNLYYKVITITHTQPNILVLSQASMVRFFTNELASFGYRVVGETRGDAVFGYLKTDVQLILIFDHFIEGYVDITRLCKRLHARSRGEIPIIVITGQGTRQRIGPFTIAAYDYIGGIHQAIDHIRRLAPVLNEAGR